jgi:hypothetical protein
VKREDKNGTVCIINISISGKISCYRAGKTEAACESTATLGMDATLVATNKVDALFSYKEYKVTFCFHDNRDVQGMFLFH